jgi:hypothetical protein
LGYNNAMLWLQTLPAFAIWIAYIVLTRATVQQRKARYARWSRRARILAMVFGIIASLAILVCGLLLLETQPNLANGGGLTGWGILIVTLMGLLYIHLQTVVVSITLSLTFPETRRRYGASESRESAESRPGENL